MDADHPITGVNSACRSTATIPMIMMPTGFRVWGLGAVLFLVLMLLAILAVRRGPTDRS